MHDNDEGLGNARGVWVFRAHRAVIRRVRSHGNHDDGDGITLSDAQDVIIDECEVRANGEDGIDAGGHCDGGFIGGRVLVQRSRGIRQGGAGFKTSGLMRDVIVRNNVA